MRVARVVAILICAVALPAFAATPNSGTLNPPSASGQTSSVSWSGGPYTGATADPSVCTTVTCDSYALTISGTPSDWTGKQVHVQINWTLPATDYDMYVHKGTLNGPVVASSGAGGTTQEQVDLNPASSSIGTGLFTVHVVYFANVGADQYHGAAANEPRR